MNNRQSDKRTEKANRDLALQSFYFKVRGLLRELEEKCPELKVLDNYPVNK